MSYFLLSCRYLSEQLLFAYTGQHESIFTGPDCNHQCRLKNGIVFYLFTSHTPCGDASIFPKEVSSDVTSTDESSKASTTDETPTNEARRDVKDEISLVESSRESVFNQGIKRSLDRSDENEIKPSELSGDDPNKRLKREEPTSTTVFLKNKESIVCVTEGWHNENIPEPSLGGTSSSLNSAGGATSQTNSCEAKISVSKPQKARTDVPKTCSDIHRTGAKCVPGGPQDLLLGGSDYHRVGLLRLKPGRGDRTLSMSCSDKMAKWNIVGCQGALLSHFLARPVYVKAVIVGK